MNVSVVIVGAGPGGLAMSHELSAAGIDHVVLERGDVGNSWRQERWDSLRLLTPNWMTTLPGQTYAGDDPDGFMSAADTRAFLDSYRRSFGAPVSSGVTVTSVRRDGERFVVQAGHGEWRCDAVVAATGGSSEPHLPALATDFPASVGQLTALAYRRPGQVDRPVLVVGASASGVQIADELGRAGHEVTISVGEHVRLPRTYRGRDIFWWLDRIGQLDERFDEVEDLARARRHASVQLVGTDERRDLDLNALHEAGVRIVGRLQAVRGTTGLCSGSLANLVKNADLKQARLLRRIDEYLEIGAGAGDVVQPAPTAVGQAPTEIDLTRFGTVIWATGYRPTYGWLPPEAFDQRGRLRHEGGVCLLPGLYVLGMPFLRRRRSNLISGLGVDATDLAAVLGRRLEQQARQRRTMLPA